MISAALRFSTIATIGVIGLIGVMAVLGLFLPGAAARAADNWPQWRGPALDGTSRDADPPLHWSRQENVVWTLAMPARSGSTPIIWEDHVFVTVGLDPREDDEIWLWDVDRTTGEIRWRGSLGRGNQQKNKQQMSSPSPVTDGTTVWALTGTGALKAFDYAGEELWTRNLQREYGAFGHKWGYAASPLLHDGSLYIPVLHGFYTDEPSYLLRLDGATGETLFRIERPTLAVSESPDAYTTPVLLRYEDRAEIVLSGGDVLTGHDPLTGEELWRAGGLNPHGDRSQRLVATPVVGPGLIFAFGKKGPILAFRVGGRGEITESHLAWQVSKGTDVPTPITDGQYLYVVNDQGIVTCHDVQTGAVVWGPERLTVGTYSASPVLAAGRIYATSEDGVTTVFRAGDRFEILATNDLGGYTLSSPAISDGQIFLRTAEALYAIGERKAP